MYGSYGINIPLLLAAIYFVQTVMSTMKIITVLGTLAILLSTASSVSAYGLDTGDGRSSDPGATAPKVCSGETPNAPSLISLQSTGPNQVTLSWNSIEHATKYAIQYGLSPRNYIYGASNVGNVLSYTVDHLQAGMTYYFAVQAINTCMPSALSNEGVGVAGQTGNQGMQYEQYAPDQTMTATSAAEEQGEQKKELFTNEAPEVQPTTGFWARIWHSIQILFGGR